MDIKLSIVTVNIEDFKIIKPTIESYINIRGDFIKDYEYIVIDSSGDINIANFCSNNEISYFFIKKSTIYAAMNKSLEYIKGEYVFYLNTGDILISKLDKFIETLELSHDVVYFPMIGHDGALEYPLPIQFLKIGEIPFSHQGVITRKSYIKFNTKFKNHADLLLYLQLFKSGSSFKFLNYPLAMTDKMKSSESRVWRQRFEPYIILILQGLIVGIIIRFIMSLYCKKIFSPNKY